MIRTSISMKALNYGMKTRRRPPLDYTNMFAIKSRKSRINATGYVIKIPTVAINIVTRMKRQNNNNNNNNNNNIN
jgi:hypothetical protein